MALQAFAHSLTALPELGYKPTEAGGQRCMGGSCVDRFKIGCSLALVGAMMCLLSACSSTLSGSNQDATPGVSAFACQQVAQTKTQSKIISPANQASNVDPYAAFQWTSDPKVVKYGVCVGTAVGQADVWGGELSGTAVYVPGLQPNTPYYVRIQVEYSNQTYAFTDSTFTTGTGLAHLTNPVDGATQVDPQVLFSWTPVLDAQMYYLYLSKQRPGGSEVYNSGQLPNASVLKNWNLVPNLLYYGSYHQLRLPQLEPNITYYARLITQKGGGSFAIDSQFETGYGIAHLTGADTADGVGGVGATPVFTWNSIGDAGPSPAYSLNLGSQPGKNDIWQSGSLSDTTVTVPEGVLEPNTTYYVQLGTNSNGSWQYSNSAFSTGSFSGSAPSQSNILYPANGTTGVDPFSPIVWSAVAQASGYTLLIGDGTTPGVNDADYVGYGLTQGTAWASGLVGGKTYYAILITVSTGPEPACSSSSPCWSQEFNFLHYRRCRDAAQPRIFLQEHGRGHCCGTEHGNRRI